MKRFCKLAALCAVFLLTICFCTTVYAVEVPPPAPAESAVPSEEPTPEPTPVPPDGTGAEESGAIPAEETEPMPVEDEMAGGRVNPTPPDGTATVIETVTEADGREFYTITTPDGNVFYLVIDFARQADNVYFLDAVTEEDLLGMTESGTVVEPIAAAGKFICARVTSAYGSLRQPGGNRKNSQ